MDGLNQTISMMKLRIRKLNEQTFKSFLNQEKYNDFHQAN